MYSTVYMLRSQSQWMAYNYMFCNSNGLRYSANGDGIFLLNNIHTPMLIDRNVIEVLVRNITAILPFRLWHKSSSHLSAIKIMKPVFFGPFEGGLSDRIFFFRRIGVDSIFRKNIPKIGIFLFRSKCRRLFYRQLCLWHRACLRRQQLMLKRT